MDRSTPPTTDIPAGLVITMDDIGRAGFCARGAKAFFREHGLDFRAFLNGGIDADALAATGDARAIQVIERKLRRPANG
jgi:hypothetical protein